MKFKFKIQKYQTDAVEATADVFAGQPNRTAKYTRDLGRRRDRQKTFDDKMGIKHIFFVAETKGSMSSMDLRPLEKAKIRCAKKLFEELSHTEPVRYHEVTDYQTMLQVLEDMTI